MVTTTFTIATWNFLAGGSAARTAHWAMVREHITPDLLMTQECTPPASGAFECATALWSEAVKRRWGSGLYSVEGDIAPIPVYGFSGWVTGGEVKMPGWLTRERVRAFSVHCPAGAGGYIKTMHRVLDAIVAVADGCDLVIGGDFNIAAGLRGGDEPVAMSKGERAVLERMRTELALTPCWQTAHPGQPLAQTLRWSGNRAAPYHCDGIFVPRRWKDKLFSCDVMSGATWDALSDHNPVVAVFRKRSESM